MNQPTNDNLRDDSAGPSEIDVLIGRIVDGEASTTQRQRFESLAAHDGSLWRRLALRHQDMAMLATHVEPTLNAAEKVELPLVIGDSPVIASLADGSAKANDRAWWWLTASGWAAMLAIATVWGSSLLISQRQMNDGVNARSMDARAVNNTPEQHLEQYMHAPYVLGDMPPTLLQVEDLPDGRLAVSYLRRIVEVKYYDKAEDIPLDADGNLSSEPRELRRSHESPLPENKPLD